MIERFKKYLEEEFFGVEDTKEMSDLKDELLSNLVDKYEEYLNLGYSSDKAFIEAIKSIGDLNDVIKVKQVSGTSLTDYNLFKRSESRFKTLSIISIGILFLGLISFVVTMLLSESDIVLSIVVQLGIELIGIILFLIGCINFNGVIREQNKDLMVQGLRDQGKYSICFTITLILSFILLWPSGLYGGLFLSAILVMILNKYWSKRIIKVTHNQLDCLIPIKKYNYIFIGIIMLSLLNISGYYFVGIYYRLMIFLGCELLILISMNKFNDKSFLNRLANVNQVVILLFYFIGELTIHFYQLNDNQYFFYFSILVAAITILLLIITTILTKISRKLTFSFLINIWLILCFILFIVFQYVYYLNYIYLAFLIGYCVFRIYFEKGFKRVGE